MLVVLVALVNLLVLVVLFGSCDSCSSVKIRDLETLNLSPRYDQVIVVRGYMDVQYQRRTLSTKAVCLYKVWTQSCAPSSSSCVGAHELYN